MHRAAHLQHFGKVLVQVDLYLLQTREQLAIDQTQPHFGTDADSGTIDSWLKSLFKLVFQELELCQGPAQFEVWLSFVTMGVVSML